MDFFNLIPTDLTFIQMLVLIIVIVISFIIIICILPRLFNFSYKSPSIEISTKDSKKIEE